MVERRKPRPALFSLGFFLLLAVGLALGACPERAPDEVWITLLTTADFHGALESPGTDPESGRPLGGAAALAATIARARETNPQGTLLLDAGDTFHGTALSNATEGRAVIDFMNRVGFDAAALGNHEFDWGLGVLGERMEQASFPFLAANLVDRQTGRPPPWLRRYAVFERRGLRIAVLGLASPDTPETTLPRHVEGLEFLDPVPVIRELVDELIPSQADVAVVLGHIGVWYDEGEVSAIGEVVELARADPGVAAILAGHTHQRFAGEIHGVPVVQAGDLGRVLGRIDLRVDPRARQVRSALSRTISVFADELEPDPQVAALVERYRDEADQRMQEVIGEAETDLGLGRGESPLGNLFTDAIRDQTDADVVLQNPLGLRAEIDRGPIRYEDVYNVMPFDNTIVFVEMTGAEIERVLEQAVDAVGFLYVSGLRYRIELDRPAGARVTISPALAQDRLYKVSINNFLAQGGDGLTLLADRPEALETGILLRDALTGWILEQSRQGRRIAKDVDGRIHIENPR